MNSINITRDGANGCAKTVSIYAINIKQVIRD